MADERQQPVPVADLEIAQRVAGAARSRSRADREPTLEQLLGAFGESEPTPEARARIASAMTLAGLGATPSVREAHPGERLKLRPPGGGDHTRALLGGAALVAVIAIAAVVALSSGGGGSGNDSAASVLPVTATQTAPAPTTTATPPPTTATTAPAPAKPKANAKAKAKGRKRKPAPAPKRLVVKLVPGPQASYLCVDHGPGTSATETTLASPLTFTGKRVRLNVGLSSVRVTINGKAFALAGSPSGYDIQLHKRTFLPQGRRPCA